MFSSDSTLSSKRSEFCCQTLTLEIDPNKRLSTSSNALLSHNWFDGIDPTNCELPLDLWRTINSPHGTQAPPRDMKSLSSSNPRNSIPIYSVAQHEVPYAHLTKSDLEIPKPLNDDTKDSSINKTVIWHHTVPSQSVLQLTPPSSNVDEAPENIQSVSESDRDHSRDATTSDSEQKTNKFSRRRRNNQDRDHGDEPTDFLRSETDISLQTNHTPALGTLPSPEHGTPKSQRAFQTKKFRPSQTDQEPKISCDFCKLAIPLSQRENHIHEAHREYIQQMKEEEELRKQYVEHKNAEYMKEVVKCSFCSRKYSRKDFGTHIMQCDFKREYFPCNCPICGSKCQTVARFNEHLHNNHPHILVDALESENVPVRCRTCSALVPRDQFFQHVMEEKEKPIRNTPFFCPLCFKMFDEQTVLEHLEHDHSDLNPQNAAEQKRHHVKETKAQEALIWTVPAPPPQLEKQAYSAQAEVRDSEGQDRHRPEQRVEKRRERGRASPSPQKMKKEEQPQGTRRQHERERRTEERKTIYEPLPPPTRRETQTDQSPRIPLSVLFSHVSVDVEQDRTKEEDKKNQHELHRPSGEAGGNRPKKATQERNAIRPPQPSPTLLFNCPFCTVAVDRPDWISHALTQCRPKQECLSNHPSCPLCAAAPFPDHFSLWSHVQKDHSDQFLSTLDRTSTEHDWECRWESKSCFVGSRHALKKHYLAKTTNPTMPFFISPFTCHMVEREGALKHVQRFSDKQLSQCPFCLLRIQLSQMAHHLKTIHREEMGLG
ncbi:hypothetical protein BLNAU_13647 [Blattamonas nauphoetae]|uniref:C2H2-type domain-containing protein n=1 Tax=Blattamonas nauphoetae TaxID=2049346 RepID=A0ABQ9XFX4_9EUKA|nr:hypothetical protein BLNAU_13647 [Blattamonas nauphoetae]